MTIDNRWIVPYNPYLCQKYDCHINVKICSSIRSVKYLYKYVYKGPDRVIISIKDSQDSQDSSEEKHLMDNLLESLRDGRDFDSRSRRFRLHLPVLSVTYCVSKESSYSRQARPDKMRRWPFYWARPPARNSDSSRVGHGRAVE